jgi:hypothetical protein
MAFDINDIAIYGSANMPENDTSTSGGTIDYTTTILQTDMSDVGGYDKLNVVSSSPLDTTQIVTITGRSSSGRIITDTYSLDGNTPVLGTKNFERILKIEVDNTYSGTLTITDNSGGQTLTTMYGTIDAPYGTANTTKRRTFYNAIANRIGTSDKYLYEKIFISNVDIH